MVPILKTFTLNTPYYNMALRFVIGRYPTGKDKFDESIASKLRNARYEVVVTAEIMPYKWGKLVVNLTNAIGAITNIGGGGV